MTCRRAAFSASDSVCAPVRFVCSNGAGTASTGCALAFRGGRARLKQQVDVPPAAGRITRWCHWPGFDRPYLRSGDHRSSAWNTAATNGVRRWGRGHQLFRSPTQATRIPTWPGPAKDVGRAFIDRPATCTLKHVSCLRCEALEKTQTVTLVQANRLATTCHSV